MNEGEAIKFRYFNILDRQLKKFFLKQNLKIVENFDAKYDEFKKNIIRIIDEDKPEAEKILRNIYTELMRNYGLWQFNELTGSITGFNPTTTEIIKSIRAMAQEQADVITESSKHLISVIAKNAIDQGWTIDQTSNLVKEKITGLAKYRAKRIARFELIGGANHASLKSAEQVSGKVQKYWIYTHDSRVRPTHKQAGIKYNNKNPIDLDKKFKVGNAELMYPADRNGDKKEIFGCRCTIGYTRKKEDSKNVNKNS